MCKVAFSPSAEALAEAIRTGDRTALSRAVTLVESTRAEHREQAQALLNRLLPHAGDSMRVGVTGAPGVGKSTLIEALGTQLLAQGRRVAVLAVDPTSERSGGSILGDKTRMAHLAADENAFIRPSPTGGTLGGVARATREAMLLCEAAGYDTVFVETVGVGQAEITARSMVDFFLLLALSGAGDALQHVKRGIIERADAVVVTKADGDNQGPAEAARAQYESALRLFPPTASKWTPPVLTCSARTGEGIDAVWQTICHYEEKARASGFFEENRRRQALRWMHQAIEHRLREDFRTHPRVQEAQEQAEVEVLEGRLSASAAAARLLARYRDAAS